MIEGKKAHANRLAELEERDFKIQQYKKDLYNKAHGIAPTGPLGNVSKIGIEQDWIPELKLPKLHWIVDTNSKISVHKLAPNCCFYNLKPFI